MGDVGVSLAEIIEVRGCGLNDDELLALIIIGCEVLTKTPAGVYAPEHVILHTDGELEIKSVSKDEVSSEYVPPEIQVGNTNVDPGAVHVYCLGEVIRFAGAAESGNADLFSLLNVMTVAHIATRPSITRLGQMAKNKLTIQNPKALLAEMYVLVMGDEAEDIDDLDISSGEYIPNSLGKNGVLKNLKWNHEKAETSKNGTCDQLRKMSQADSFDGEENTGIWRLSEEDPFSSVTIACEKALPETKDENSQPLEEKQQKLSVGKIEVLLEQNEEEGKLIPESSLRIKSLSYDFDDDIVEYREKNISPDELTSIPTIVTRDCVEKVNEIVDYNGHKLLSTDIIHECNDSVSSLSPISEVDEGQKIITSTFLSSNGQNIVDGQDSLKESNHESSAVNKNGNVPEVVLSKKENGEEPPSPVLEPRVKEVAARETSDISIATEQKFMRRNSLLPNRISGRKSSSKHFKRRLKAEPEFIRNVNASSICLKAPAQRKKKVTLHRIEHTDVTVELLSGKHVEVSCRSDAVALEIADVVMRHMNFNENSFFGLTILRDGEHFFLDDHQRLEKFAPPGWKNARQYGSSKRLYMLYLRFRYYPASIVFIRTEVVLHELYLQLRRDILDDRIQPKRDLLYDLAAFALQSEYSDQPNVTLSDYFDVQHYIPKRYLDNCNEKTIIKEIIEKHGRYRGMKQQDAEKRFILLCQRLPDYGAHLHRVFASKPSINLGNTPFGDPETGVTQWIGIMTRGIVLFEEESDGRHAQIEHLWQNTQTLQFDKKRFVIASEIHEPSTSVFYADHYTKSAYFVRFAASQHRFMIKMRQWNHTLRRDSPFQFRKMPDVGADTNFVEEVLIVISLMNYMSACDKASIPESSFARNSDQYTSGNISSKKHTETAHDSSFKPRTSSINDDRILEEISPEESTENGGGYILEILLEKDPSSGLGLTLVDGNLNGVTGVYVKSVSEEGVGKKGGVNVGDRLLSVNNVSLIGKDRHVTVDLVKKCGNLVHLKIFRLEAITSALASGIIKDKTVVEDQKGYKNNSLSVSEGLRSRTPPPPRKYSNILKKRTRAVSDFGAVGDTLPDLNSEDLLSNLRSESKLRYLRPETLLNEVEYGMGHNVPVVSMYKFEGVDDEFVEHSPKRSSTESYFPFKTNENDWLKTGKSNANQQKLPSAEWKSVQDYRKKPNLDWADDLDDIVEPLSSDISLVTLERNESGSLGFQIASSAGIVYIKQITAEPALTCPDIQVGDKIVSVNHERVQNLTHQQLVDLLRKGGDKVVIGLQNSDKEIITHDESEQTIRVVLEKSHTGSLGLSLAKKTGFDGIYIRMISSGSAADIDGTLHIGDKIWKVNGQSVRNCTPGAIVDLLKAASNPVEIIVKRAVVK
uniref:FERM domain-containing protein n=1 Tax=Onchocerca volvulus TaxID=6282 RepID=A0A8R1TT13_ONCVO